MKKKLDSKKDIKTKKEKINHPFMKQKNMSWKSRIFFFFLILILTSSPFIIIVMQNL